MVTCAVRVLRASRIRQAADTGAPRATAPCVLTMAQTWWQNPRLSRNAQIDIRFIQGNQYGALVPVSPQ